MKKQIRLSLLGVLLLNAHITMAQSMSAELRASIIARGATFEIKGERNTFAPLVMSTAFVNSFGE